MILWPEPCIFWIMTFLIRLLDPLDKYKTKANDVTIPS